MSFDMQQQPSLLSLESSDVYPVFVESIPDLSDNPTSPPDGFWAQEPSDGFPLTPAPSPASCWGPDADSPEVMGSTRDNPLLPDGFLVGGVSGGRSSPGMGDEQPDGALCEFGELLDSFEYFLGEAGSPGGNPAPAFEVDLPTPGASLTLQEASGLLADQGRDGSAPSPELLAPCDLLHAQSEGLTRSNSSAHSGNISKRSHSMDPLVGERGAGSSLLDKLKDLCKSGSCSTLLNKTTQAQQPAEAAAVKCSPAPPPVEPLPVHLSPFAPVSTPISTQTGISAKPWDIPVAEDWPWEAFLKDSEGRPWPQICEAGDCHFPQGEGGESSEPSQKGESERISGVGGGMREKERRGGAEQEDEEVDDPEEKLRQQRLERNRQSALQSRQRRKQYVQELEQRCRMLEGQVAHMRQIVAMTALENGALRDEVVRLQMGGQQQQEAGQKPGAALRSSTSPVPVSKSLGPLSPPSSSPRPASPSLLSPPSPPSGAATGGFSKASSLVVISGGREDKACTGGLVKELQQPEEHLKMRSSLPQQQPKQQLQHPLGAVRLGAEPAALESDSLQSESLLTQPQSQPQDSSRSSSSSSSNSGSHLSSSTSSSNLFAVLHLFFLLAAFQAVSAVAMSSLISLFQSLPPSARSPGPSHACPSPHSRPQMQQRQSLPRTRPRNLPSRRDLVGLCSPGLMALPAVAVK